MKDLSIPQPKHSSRLSFQITKKQIPEAFVIQSEENIKYKNNVQRDNSQSKLFLL